jgi:hypothetical protein
MAFHLSSDKTTVLFYFIKNNKLFLRFVVIALRDQKTADSSFHLKKPGIVLASSSVLPKRRDHSVH